MLLAFFLAAGVGGVLMAGLAVPFATAAGTATNSATGLFDDLPADLNPSRPSEVSVLYYADGSVMASFWQQNRINVPLDQVSQPMRDAIVAIEDHRFLEHNGVDLEGMARALVNNMQGGSTEGASTLTQQYVKNVFVEKASQLELTDAAAARELYESATAQSYGRKLQEARYAIQLEKQYSKAEILEGYLNLAQFGPSVYGVEAASQHFFGHSASELSLAEASLLAGIPQSPNNHDPLSNPENARARQAVVLSAMQRDGLVDQAQVDEVLAIPVEELTANHQTRQSGCGVAGISAYYCTYVVRDLYTNPDFASILGESFSDRQATLLRGGLQVTTTLDPHRQQLAYDAVVAQVPVNDRSGVSMALTSIEPGTGRVQAMVQNTNFGKNPNEADPSQTEVNYNVGVSHGGGQGFQSGSAFKVFTLTEWLRTNHALRQQIPAQIRDYPTRSWNISCAPEYRAHYTPNNIEGGYNAQTISVLEATKRSINLPFVWMANQMDMCSIMGVASAMGVERGNGEDLELYPSGILGSNTVTPISMANAFATLANQGVACEPVAITAITNREGQVFDVPSSTCTEVITPEVARGVTYALQSVVEPSGTGFRAALPGRPVAGKTGTANMDTHAWFVGYTPQLASAVWMGHSDADISMFHSVINRRYHREVYGGLLTAAAFRSFMSGALEGEPVLGFNTPTQRTIEGEQRDVPYVLGRSPDNARSILENAGFTVTISGSRIYSSAPAGTVAAQNPSGRAAVNSAVHLTLSAGPAPVRRPEPEAPAPPPPAEEQGGDNGGDNGNVDGNGDEG